MKKGIKLIDNSSNEYQPGSVLKVLINDKSYSQISIATGYWYLPGMVEILTELSQFLERENITFRLLLGEEPSVKAYQVKKPAIQDPDFPEKYLKKDLEDLQLKEEFQKVADLLGKYIRQTTLSELRKLPIPVVNHKQQQPFIERAEKILSLKKKNQHSTTLEKEIDVLVYKLYELSYEEVKIIDKDFWLLENEYNNYKTE
ncbi:MAG: hypothetical protein ABIN97_16330 [Ginsengibacter sp.]